MSPRPSMKPARVSKRIDAFIRGVQKRLAPGVPFKVDGVTYDQASLLAKLLPVQQANLDVAEARMTLSQKVVVREGLHEAIRPFLGPLSDAFRNMYGSSNPGLSDFGVSYDKPRRKLTAEQKAIATAEGVRTRRARGSYTSAKQRAQITAEGLPGLLVVDPQGNVKELLPPASPGKARPKPK